MTTEEKLKIAVEALRKIKILRSLKLVDLSKVRMAKRIAEKALEKIEE